MWDNCLIAGINYLAIETPPARWLHEWEGRVEKEEEEGGERLDAHMRIASSMLRNFTKNQLP